MTITNLYDLPDALVKTCEALEASYQSTHKKKSDISVTQLLAPVQLVQLQRENEVSEDVSDRIWAMLGSVMHEILEKAETSVLTEERLYADILGWTVSGQYDRMSLESKTLGDWKLCSVWEHLNGVKPERTAQLNMLAMLAKVNGYVINHLEIVAIYRDWSMAKAKQGGDYPRSQVAVIPIELWPIEKTIAYMEARVRLHQDARDGDIEPCTPEDMWQKPTTYAVMKEGRKSAMKVEGSWEEAWNWSDWKGILAEPELDESGNTISQVFKKNYSIVERTGENTRCENYCPASEFCPQWGATRRA